MVNDEALRGFLLFVLSRNTVEDCREVFEEFLVTVVEFVPETAFRRSVAVEYGGLVASGIGINHVFKELVNGVESVSGIAKSSQLNLVNVLVVADQDHLKCRRDAEI